MPSSAYYQKRRKAPLPSQRYRERFLFLFLIFLATGLAIFARLFFLQVIEAPALAAKAEKARQNDKVLFRRGRILDRNGVVLAQDSILYDLYAHPRYYYEQTPKQIARVIAPVLEQSEADLVETLSQPYFTILLAKNLDNAKVEKLRSLKLTLPVLDEKTGEAVLDKAGNPQTKTVKVNGLDFSRKPVRRYPQGRLAAHVIGYVNDEAGVAAGVEESAKSILKGESTYASAQPSQEASLLRAIERNPIDWTQEMESFLQMSQADDVVLTLDSRLQYVAEKALAEGVESSKAEQGTAILIQPKTGEILAFANYPSFSPETYFKSSQKELKNWALSDVYPPGST